MAASRAELFAGSSLQLRELEDALTHAGLSELRHLGARSSVFKARLDGTSRAAAFKVATRDKPNGPAAEVAAYRLSRALGLSNVPPAVTRRVPVASLRAALRHEAPDKAAETEAGWITARDGKVIGAAIHWIEGLSSTGLDSSEGQARTLTWLAQGTQLSDADAELASPLATVIAFDYLIGNFDRYSGGNLKTDATGRVVYVRDHDLAFARRLNDTLHRRLLDPVLATERYSKAFVQALRALSRERFVAELVRDPGYRDDPWLDERRMDEVFDRREALLSHIAAAIEEHGVGAVLAFP